MTTSSGSHARGAGTGAANKAEEAVLTASAHLTGRNWFFVALARHAREHGAELREWLNEADTAARYQDAAIRVDDRARLPRPDGAGTWAEDGRVVSFLLEYGTEHLPVLAGK